MAPSSQYSRVGELPNIDICAVFPAGRTATTKARTFVSFVHEMMHRPSWGKNQRLASAHDGSSLLQNGLSGTPGWQNSLQCF